MTRAAFGLGLVLVAFLAGTLGYVAGGGGRFGAPPSPPGFFGSAPSFADVVAQVNPAVVHVDVIEEGPGSAEDVVDAPVQDVPRRGEGSGFIVDPEGYILTNHHLVPGTGKIRVRLADRRELPARLVGSDPSTDLALLKLDARGLPTVRLGDSDRLRVGDWVCAIGNPLEFDHTVTVGVVSSLGRKIWNKSFDAYIQTDAAINPGNSGGALINTEGKLVGINTAILSRTGGYQGIGLAIPSSMAQPIMETLKQSGKVSRGFLGVGIQDVDHDLVSALKLSSQNGVLLTEVRNGGPGGKAGLQRGDVVTKVDGRAVTSTGQFRNMIASSGAKKRVTLEVVRDGKPLSLGVELGEVPDEAGQAAIAGPGGAPQATSGGALDGVTLEELTPEHRRTLGLSPEVQRGVVITDLEPRSPAAKAGLRPGDVVLELNRVPVDSLAKFKEQYAKASGDVLLLVQRRGGTVFLVVRK